MEFYNKWLNYYCKHPDEIKYSKAWLKSIFDCTPEGRKICQGACCKHHVNKTTKKNIYVKYRDDEWALIPDNIKKEIIPFLMEDRTVKNKDGVCTLIPFCMKHPEYEPRECKITPLTFSKDGVLKVGRMNILGRCPNFKKGNTPVWIALKDNLISLFGEKFYKRLEKDMEKEVTVDKWL